MRKLLALWMAFTCFVSMYARDVYLVGDCTPAGWSVGADALAKTTMTEISTDVYQWTGVLTKVTTGEGFKILTQKDWNPAIHPSVADLVLNEKGSDVVNLPYNGDPDTKWKISETAEYIVTVTFRESDVLVECVKAGMVTVDIPQVDGVYQLASAEKLELFSTSLNEGIIVNDCKAVLTQDVDLSDIDTWTPIGTDAKKFIGTFDGQGYRIKGMKIDGSKKEQGFFGVVGAGAVIKNLIMDASCSIVSTGGSCMSAFVGCCNNSGTITFENCGNEAQVTGTQQNNAAFVGCNYGGETKLVFNNCYNTGKISGGRENGAFSGWTGGGATFNNCYNIGEVEDGETWARGNKTINNCYQTVGNDNGVTKIDASAVASGELAFKLNGDQSSISWYQTIDTDDMPVPFSSHGRVYANKRYACDGVTEKEGIAYGNKEEKVIDEHVFGSDGLCAVCKTPSASPYMGVSISDIEDGKSYYLYNVDFKNWLGDNKRNSAYGWTSHAELDRHGRDIKFIKKGNGWQLDPKMGNNHSINSGNLYMDTGDAVTVWTIEAVKGAPASNTFIIKSGEKGLSANDVGDMDENSGKHNIWQIVTRDEILKIALEKGSEENPVDISGLVLGGTFPVADDHRDDGSWQGDKGSNASGGDGPCNFNRVWELWNISNRDIYQDISVPNGKYRVSGKAIFVSTGNDGTNADRYNAYKNGDEPTKGFIYANDQQTPMINAYEYVSNERRNDYNTKELGNGLWMMNGTNEYSRHMADSKHVPGGDGQVENIDIDVKSGKIRLGFKVEGGNNAWILINNIDLYCLGEITIDLTEYYDALNDAITRGENIAKNVQDGGATPSQQQDLTEALNIAHRLIETSSEDTDALLQATMALNSLCDIIEPMSDAMKNITKTLYVGKEDGTVTDEQFEDFIQKHDVCENKTQAEELLRLIRNVRKLNAIEKVDISMIECSEPTAEEADYYLYNVGAGIFFNTTSDWGTHIALDNPGMLIHFLPDGEWSGAAGRPVFHLSGNGWNGMNWQEEYWDKNGENKLAFVPVEGKEKVYYMCEWDAYNWHFVYDPAEDVCDGNTHYWNAVQKRDKNVNDYKNDPYAQWMLVSPAAYKAAMTMATGKRPLDVTYLIENPNFSKVEGGNWARGWTGVGDQKRGQDREPWCVIEWFEKDANMTQTITGLPAGRYVVSCYGFYRDGSSDHEAEKVRNGDTPIQNAFLFANDQEVALPNVTSEAGNMPGVGETREGVEEFACWPWQANEYFQSGLYKISTPVVEVGEDGKLTIGVRSTYNGEEGSWVVVGNFRLTSLGTPVKTTISENGYATFVAPGYIEDIPEGVEVFAAQLCDGYVHLEPTTAIPSGEAVVLKAAEGTYSMYLSATEGNLALVNDLKPATTEITADGTQYILVKLDGKVGFAKATPETKIAAGKGYLQIPLSITVKSFYPFADDETAIENVNVNDNADNGAIYNIAGQRVSKLQKGINIVGGKKVMY